MLGLKESLLVFTGGYNTGKTTAALTYAPPDKFGRVFYHDGENSGNRFVEQAERTGLSIGYRNNLDDRWRGLGLPGKADLLGQLAKGKQPWVNPKQKNSMIEFYHYILDDLDKNLKRGEFDVYIFDPVARLEAGMQAYVLSDRQATGWQRKGYGEMWWAGFYPLYRGLFSAIRDRGVEVIILTAHLGNPWTEEGAIPGKVKPKAKPELYKLAQGYFWLVQEPSNSDGAPAGVVLKERLGTVEVSGNTWDIQRRLPRRIPHFSWADVARYMKDGCDLANPASGESLSLEEQEMIDDALSEKQMQLMLLRAQTSYAEARKASDVPVLDEGESQEQTANRLAGQGMIPQEIADTLNLPLPIVVSWISQ